MHSRESLHQLLCEVLGSDNVYYQPPETIKLVYPCIIYSREGYDNSFSSNTVYLCRKKYSITVITKSPKDDIPDLLNVLPYVRHSRHYVVDNLYHDVFDLYY